MGVNEGILKRKLKATKPSTSDKRCSLKNGVQRDSESSSSGSEETAEAPKGGERHKLSDSGCSSGEEWTNEFSDLGSIEKCGDILDFSIESGEESPCDESLLEDERFDLIAETFDLRKEGIGRESDEETTNQDAVTVINAGLMARSDDTLMGE